MLGNSSHLLKKLLMLSGLVSVFVLLGFPLESALTKQCSIFFVFPSQKCDATVLSVKLTLFKKALN